MVCAMKKAGALSILFVVVLLAAVVMASAQQPKTIPRIGYLGGSTATFSPRIDAFRQGLRELGYVEGQNITTEYHMRRGRVKN
jgi:putative ABC transport system substrate-binding protein